MLDNYFQGLASWTVMLVETGIIPAEHARRLPADLGPPSLGLGTSDSPKGGVCAHTVPI